MQYRYAIQICNKHFQYRYAIQVCNKDVQYRYAMQICNTGNKVEAVRGSDATVCDRCAIKSLPCPISTPSLSRCWGDDAGAMPGRCWGRRWKRCWGDAIMLWRAVLQQYAADMQHRYAVKNAIDIWSTIQPTKYFYTTFTHTIKLIFAVGALCWDNFL